jgi:hypothetical protein
LGDIGWLFPTRFALNTFVGPRGSQYREPEDAFQQLIGEGLREEWGGSVFVAPTRRPDVGIDAFVVGMCI